MKKITLLFAVFFAAMICLSSCGGGSGSDPDPEPEPEPTPTNPVKYLSAKEFTGSEWGGKDANGDVTLKVTTATSMTLNYYIKTTLSKKTEELVLQTATIAYTFDEANGTFSGKDGSTSYSGTLTSKTALTLKMPSSEVNLTKK